jgi:hypothetical protein
MGLIILQLADTNITYGELGFLESFKDLPIAFISLFAVSFINKTGAKKALILALAIVGFCSCLLPFVEVSGSINYGLPLSGPVLPSEKSVFSESSGIIFQMKSHWQNHEQC